ncbi:MAG: outer membrane beta-barrel protein [bacterium]
MNIVKYAGVVCLLIIVSFVVLVLPLKADEVTGFTQGTSSSETKIQVPEATTVSPITGERSLKNVWSIGANIAYSSYSISSEGLNDLTNQTGSIGYSGIFTRYGVTEEFMLTGEIDYLYGLLSSNISGTTIENSYSGFPISINMLLMIPMNSFNMYAGAGPIYLTTLLIKQKIGSGEWRDKGYGLGGQGILGIETYLTEHSSLGLELRYKRMNLYRVNGKYIAPLDNLTIGLNLIFYI